MQQKPVLTPVRREVAEFIRNFRAEHGYGPEVPEINEALPCYSVGKIRDTLTWLKARQVITFLPWNDEHHWRSFDVGPRFDAVLVDGEGVWLPVDS